MAGFKQLIMRWKHKTLHRHFFHCNNNVVVHDSNKTRTNKIRYSPSGYIFVFVGHERKRFTIPLRFLNLNIFKCLLKEAAEEFGLGVKGCLVLPCEMDFFREIVKHVKKDEHKYGKFSLEEFANMIFNSYEENNNILFTPLLQEATWCW